MSVFLLDPQAQRIVALPFPPLTREELAYVLGAFPYAPLEIRRLGLDVDAVGAHKHDIRPAALVVASGAQPAVADNEAAYYVQGVPIVGKALLAAQAVDAGSFELGLPAPTHFLRLPWTPSEAAAIVEWARAPVLAAQPARPYDLASLESYIKHMSAAAAPVYEGGGCLRLYAVDPFGADAGAMNFIPSDVQSMRRYALDCYDRQQSVQHELAVRATAPYGSVTQTPVIGLWAELVASESGADFRVTAPSGQHFAKLTHHRSESYDKRLAKSKPKRIPLPGVPTWEDGPQLVTWASKGA